MLQTIELHEVKELRALEDKLDEVREGCQKGLGFEVVDLLSSNFEEDLKANDIDEVYLFLKEKSTYEPFASNGTYGIIHLVQDTSEYMGLATLRDSEDTIYLCEFATLWEVETGDFKSVILMEDTVIPYDTFS
ncbi:hypothetical protein [Bacillus mycoides]|uniref:Uncharacterized protein n=1 Tax=Bacillus mycoides TaxID=1405 RepID=A0A1G4EJZ0_BACMY|nr:hypothetical protein [Bacillus mycoides]SCB67377.1 Protein of unknown function [Bacillus mycoides]